MIAGAKPGYLAEVRDCGSGDVGANARLSAAAPDLLEALEDLASLAEAAMREVGEYDIEAELADARAAIAKATGRVVADDAAPECTCAAKDMTFGRCCKLTPNKCKWCGHDIHAHDKQYGCAEDGCDCETPNAES